MIMDHDFFGHDLHTVFSLGRGGEIRVEKRTFFFALILYAINYKPR